MTELKQPVFAVDIDNVLAYAEREVQRIYKELTNQPWPRDFYASAGGLNGSRIDRDLIEQIFDYFHDTSIPLLSVMPGARMALEMLSRRYRIIIVTARRPSSRPQTVSWLQAHRIPYDELYLTDEKAEVSETITLFNGSTVEPRCGSSTGHPSDGMGCPGSSFKYRPDPTMAQPHT